MHTFAIQIVVQDLSASKVWREILFSCQNINCADTKKKTAAFPSKPHKEDCLKPHDPTKIIITQPQTLSRQQQDKLAVGHAYDSLLAIYEKSYIYMKQKTNIP
jgi:hypothetical protein